MKEENTLVSVVLPLRNGQRHLTEALESILSQSYTNLEVLAIDDFSSDQSLSILKAFRRKDKRVRVFSNKKRYGLAVSLNRALKKAKGRFIAFMDSGDLSYKQRLEKQVAYLLGNPKTVGVGSQCRFIDMEEIIAKVSSFPLTHEEISKTLFAGLSLQPETFILNRLVFPKDALRFEGTAYRFSPEERRVIYANALIRLVQYGELANLGETLYKHRNPQLVQSAVSFMKLWVKSNIFYDYRPSLKSLFLPFANPLKSNG